jgi:hypothetical protein
MPLKSRRYGRIIRAKEDGQEQTGQQERAGMQQSGIAGAQGLHSRASGIWSSCPT